MVADGTSQLDYGRTPGSRRRLWRAGVVLAVLSVAAAVFKWGPAWKEHAAVLRDQRRCMNYRAAADQVVFDTAWEMSQWVVGRR